MLGKFQFGDYELDRDALELRKHGVPVRLQEQPLRVLATLVERPGEIVTREELQQRIWGKDTFVDFEQSLNKAVNRLREALNDEAGQPRYVETVPRRGYRFIAPVAGPIPVEPPGETSVLSSVTDAEPAVARSPKRRFVTVAILTAASVLVGVGVAAILLWKRPENPASAEITHITSAAYCCPKLSRDGKLLAYVSGAGGGMMHIWVQQTAGGGAIPVTRGTEGDFDPDFSPDGTHIAFFSGKGILYVAPSLSGEPRLVAKTHGRKPLFSPDGRQILYWEGLTTARVISVEGGEQIPVSFNRDFLVHAPPLWSPNGQEIIFYGVGKSQQDKADGWWVAPVRGEEPRPLQLPHGGQGYSGDPVVQAWVRSKDGSEWIIYSESTGEVWKMFRIGVSDRGNIEGKPEPLTTGTGKLTGNVSVAEDGKLVYATASFTESIYEISMDSRGQKLDPAVQLPLPDGASYTSPSVSRDGKWMAYNASIPGKSNNIMLNDFRTGTDQLLDGTGRDTEYNPKAPSAGEASIAPDGSKVIFERNCKTGRWPYGGLMPCSFMVPAAGGEPDQVCDFCTPRGFSSNGSIVLMQKYPLIHEGRPIGKIVALDLTAKTEKDFLGTNQYHAFFSWDDRWVVFKKVTESVSLKPQILVAPVQDNVAGNETEWIAVTDGRFNDDKPQFSPDGNTVYFTSTRDGYVCIWAQKLDPRTKRPLGDPVAFEHFHNFAQRDAAPVEDLLVNSNLSVARDKMVINLPQIHSDIWMTQVK